MEELRKLIEETIALECMESDYPKYSDVGDDLLDNVEISNMCEELSYGDVRDTVIQMYIASKILKVPGIILLAIMCHERTTTISFLPRDKFGEIFERGCQYVVDNCPEETCPVGIVVGGEEYFKYGFTGFTYKNYITPTSRKIFFSERIQGIQPPESGVRSVNSSADALIDSLKSRGECTLTPLDIVNILNEYNGYCDNCGIKVLITDDTRYPDRYWIGRIDNEGTYEYSNCRLICADCDQKNL